MLCVPLNCLLAGRRKLFTKCAVLYCPVKKNVPFKRLCALVFIHNAGSHLQFRVLYTSIFLRDNDMVGDF